MESIMDIETIEDFSDVEEGEILDDSFDAISDDSFIFLQNTKGKLDTRESDLRALSLSSISDEEESPRKHHSRRRKSQQRHKRKRLLRNGVNSSSESDSDEMVSLNKNLLKEAIRLDHAEELHKNSLSTRLKGMISDSPRKNAKSDLKTISSPTNSAPEQIIIDSDSSDETELIQLRLEALKTAVLNKVTVRKRRKLLEENNASKNEQKSTEQNVETNKENNKAEDANIIKIDDENSKKESDNEDEDVLRAILLASISQKITKKTTSEVPFLKNSVNSAKNVFSTGYIKPSSQTTTSSQVSNEKNALPSAKNALPSGKNALPSGKNALPSNKNDPPSKINALPSKNTVLPSQNAQNSKKTLHNAKTIHNLTLKAPNVVAPPKINVKPLIINFTSDTDSEDDTKVSKQVTKKPNVENSLKIFLRQNKNNSEVKNNQEKQNEGLQLTIDNFLKQQRAQVEATQPKTPISKKTHPQEVNDLVLKSAVKLLPKNKQIEYQKLMERLKNAEKSKNSSKNGSISIAKRVRRLSQKIGGEEKKVDLAKKKLELSALHRTLKDVQCLENGRLQIKEKYNELTPLMKKINEATNDRKKQEIRIKTLFSQLAEARTNLTKSHDVFSNLVNEFIAKKQSIDVSDLKAAKVPETKVVENSLQDIVDPNDIVFKKKENNAAPVSNYVSPLDFSDRKSAPMVDPLGILCPYEINGLCKDADCKFNHYLKT